MFIILVHGLLSNYHNMNCIMHTHRHPWVMLVTLQDSESNYHMVLKFGCL